MQAKEIVKLVEELSEPIINEKNFEFVDAEFVKEGPNWYLRLFVDKEGGITIDELEYVSRALDEKLPEDITEQPFILEVSSPGIDRVLKRDKEYVKYKGKLVDVKLFKAVNGIKEYQGELVGLIDGNVVILDENGNNLSFPKEDVATTRLAVVF
ncbi:MAG: ribosome maturation factor RimP [Lachnospirales bacterium]